VLEVSNPLRVVMVDDDPDDVFLTKIICKRSSVPVSFTGLNSGRALYNHIKNKGIGSIDIILLDVNMPIENGYAVLKRLQAYPNIDDVTVIMFSTSRRPHEKELAMELGSSGFIEKPSRGDDVSELVNVLSACRHEKFPLAIAAE